MCRGPPRQIAPRSEPRRRDGTARRAPSRSGKLITNASSTCPMTPARADQGHGRRPHITGSDSAPSANTAPAGRRSAGLRTAAAVAIANETRGAERPVPQKALTTADCGSREEPTPRGSPAMRWRAATAAPARSRMTSALKHQRAVVTLRWGSAIPSTVLIARDAVSRAGRSDSGEASTHRDHGAGHPSSAYATPLRPKNTISRRQSPSTSAAAGDESTPLVPGILNDHRTLPVGPVPEDGTHTAALSDRQQRVRSSRKGLTWGRACDVAWVARGNPSVTTRDRWGQGWRGVGCRRAGERGSASMMAMLRASSSRVSARSLRWLSNQAW